MIDNQFFVCYPESPSFLTYRARLEGTRETDSDSLISLIEEWVRGGVSLTVTGVLMTVDPHCSVAISSPDQPECSPLSNTQPSTNSSSTSSTETSSVTTADRSTGDDSSSTTTAIIGGVVAIVLIIVVAIVIIVIIISLLVLKSHRGGFSVKNTDKKYAVLLLLKLKSLESYSFAAGMEPQEVVYQLPPMRHMGRWWQEREKRDMRWWRSLTETLQLNWRRCMRFPCLPLPLPPVSLSPPSLSLPLLEMRRTLSMMSSLEISNSTCLIIIN